MVSWKERLQKVVHDLEVDLARLIRMPEYDHIVVRANPPASPADLARLEKHVGVPLPPSYRAFLELHDGYQGLAYPGDMLSIQEMLPTSERYRAIQKWKKTSAKYGSTEVLDGIVIANMGSANGWTFLDPNRTGKGKGELKVVEWDPEDSSEFGHLVAFLEECLATVRYGLGEGGSEDEGSGDEGD